MDAQSHLKRLGWQGKGLGRQQNGINKPLLVSNKQNVLGLGSKSLKEKQADQWWLRAFDSALKDFGTGNQSALGQVSKLGISRGGLYGFFVKGEGLAGTWTEDHLRDSRSDTSSVEPVVVSQVHAEIEMAPSVLLGSKKRKRSEGDAGKLKLKKSKKGWERAAGSAPAAKPQSKKAPREERRALRKLQKQEQARANANAKEHSQGAVEAGSNSSHLLLRVNSSIAKDSAEAEHTMPDAGTGTVANPTSVLQRLQKKQPPFVVGELPAALLPKANELDRARVQKFARRALKKGKSLETMVRREVNKWENVARRKSRKLERRAKKKREKAAS